MSNESEGWLRTLYAEAWKQYSHEDNLSQSRNNLFLGVQAAMIAILAGISGSLIGMEPIEIGSHQLWVGFGVLGIFTVTRSFRGSPCSLLGGSHQIWTSIPESKMDRDKSN